MLEKGDTLTVGTHRATVVRFLSEGGFSKIYEVTMDPEGENGTTACLKQVLVRDKAGLVTLRKEVDVMKTLRKARSIVRYYDSNAETLPDGTIQVLVLMELCPNNSLLHYMNDRIRQKLTEDEILKIMMDISIGIYEMHRLSLVHRDIKIENVLIDSSNRFKLCDFGSVSKPIRPPKDQQEFQMLSHDILYQTTPQYRAPEMIDLYRGLPIDERSDIWALGCFLYKLCYYTTPFEASGDIAILHASFQFPPAPPFSGDLKNLIIIMLQENPLYRPNIVQIIMLVAKLIQANFDSLQVEDFYQAGPYDFQALHAIQKEKQNEQLKRQQYYYDQQLQQQKYDQQKYDQKHSTSRSSSHSQLQNLTGQPTFASKNDEFHENLLDINRSSSRAASMKSIATASSAASNLQYSATEPVVGTQEVSEIENLEEFPDLENAAERYPSLDAIDQAVSNDSQQKSTNDAVSKRSIDSKRTDIMKTSSRPSEFENVEAWQKSPRNSIDKDAEKLVEDIFVQGGDKAPPKSDLSLRKSVSNPSSRLCEERCERPLSESAAVSPELWKTPVSSTKSQSQPEPTKSRDESVVPDYFGQKNDSSLQSGKHSEQVSKRSSEASYYQAPNVDNNTYLATHPEIRRDNSNPWGNALESVSHPAQVDVSSQMANMSLDPGPKNENLIDFDDTGIQYHGAMVSANPSQAPIPETEVSLLDMDSESIRRNSDGKPKFKKKLSSMQPQMEFQEQVIDFASDDENNNSQMSRMSIRNTLKKSRKNSDHRRSDSAQGEGKKRLSFFGNE